MIFVSQAFWIFQGSIELTWLPACCFRHIMIIVKSSFSLRSVFKTFFVHTKIRSRCFQIARFWELFRKAPFSCRPTAEIDLRFQTYFYYFPGVAWTGPGRWHVKQHRTRVDKNKLQEFTDPDVYVYVVYNKGFHVLYVTRLKVRLNLFRKDILLFWKTNLSTVFFCTSLLGWKFRLGLVHQLLLLAYLLQRFQEKTKEAFSVEERGPTMITP